MKLLKRLLFPAAIAVIVLGTLGLTWPFPPLFTSPNNFPVASNDWLNREMQIIESRTNIDPSVLRLSLVAYSKARREGLDSKQLLTVIDYSKPSDEKRLWVFDLRNGRTLFNTWVSHGKNSGQATANSFSNDPGSLKSSLGVFVTDSTPYNGDKGIALRMKGLEPGINNNAYSRDIVFHGAWYVNADTIRKYGEVGRSWGCPAVSPELAKPLIDTIKDDTVVFAYYPDHNWLAHSRFIS